MKLIAHRINTIDQLKKIDCSCGVEVDLRDQQNQIILQHDPFKQGENFEEYLKNYTHNFIVLNIKSEGIEYRVLELLKKYNIDRYVFLDCSFPMVKKLIDLGEKSIAIRFSEIESFENLKIFQGKCLYSWVDCFSELPLTKRIEIEIREMNFQIILVSPELHGRDDVLDEYQRFINENNILLDFVCTKSHHFQKWKI